MSLFNGSFTKTMQMLEKGLDTSMMRRNVLANNIANVDVPHFKRSDVSFEAELKRSVESEKKEKETPKLFTVHREHYDSFQPREWSKVSAKIHTDYLSSMRNDGNNVDIEDEVTKLTQNQMQYTMYVERLGSQFRLLNNLIRLA